MTNDGLPDWFVPTPLPSKRPWSWRRVAHWIGVALIVIGCILLIVVAVSILLENAFRQLGPTRPY